MNQRSAFLWMRLALSGAIAGMVLGHILDIHAELALNTEAADLLSASVGAALAVIVVKANRIV